VDAPISYGILFTYILMRAVTAKWNHAPERASRPFFRRPRRLCALGRLWMFVLEDYEHARARGAKIYAELAGYGSTCEAFHRVRLKNAAKNRRGQ